MNSSTTALTDHIARICLHLPDGKELNFDQDQFRIKRISEAYNSWYGIQYGFDPRDAHVTGGYNCHIEMVLGPFDLTFHVHHRIALDSGRSVEFVGIDGVTRMTFHLDTDYVEMRRLQREVEELKQKVQQHETAIATLSAKRKK